MQEFAPDEWPTTFPHLRRKAQFTGPHGAEEPLRHGGSGFSDRPTIAIGLISVTAQAATLCSGNVRSSLGYGGLGAMARNVRF
jgi:hypothetical protein